MEEQSNKERSKKIQEYRKRMDERAKKIYGNNKTYGSLNIQTKDSDKVWGVVADIICVVLTILGG